MDLLLPEFATRFLEFFHVCARIDRPSEELLSWLSELDDNDDYVETSFETAKRPAWIIAMANTVEEDSDGIDEANYVHFHVSAALGSFFSAEKNEKSPTHTSTQLSEFCQRFENENLDTVRVRSKFVIPQSELPERSVALLLGTKASVGGKKVVIDTFEARFEDEKSSHGRMEWSTRKKDDSRILFLSSHYSDGDVSSKFMRDYESKISQDLNCLVLENKV